MSKKRFPLRGVILVSFEYPPRRLSAVSDTIAELAAFLSGKGVKTWVVTFDDWRSGIEEEEGGVIVNRIPNYISNNISFFSMVMNCKNAYQEAITAIIYSAKIDLVHLFEWMCLPSFIGWGNEFSIPMIYSTSSIQSDRDATASPYNDGIKKIEQMGMETVNRILANSKELAQKIVNEYKIIENKVWTLAPTNKNFPERTLEIYLDFLSERKKKQKKPKGLPSKEQSTKE